MVNRSEQTANPPGSRTQAEGFEITMSFWTLGRKVLAAYLIHVLLLIALLGCGVYWVVWRHLREEKPVALQSLAQTVTGVIEKEVEGLGLLVKNMVENDAVLKYKSSYNLQALKRHLHQYVEKFQWVSFYDGQGAGILHLSDGHFIDIQPGRRSGILFPANGLESNQLQVAVSTSDTFDNQPEIELAYRHIDFFDETLGAVVVGVSPKRLANVILASVDTGDSTLVVLDNLGNLLFSNHISSSPGLSEELATLVEVNNGSLAQHRLFGKDCFIARWPIESLGWTVLAMQPNEIYYADLRKLAWGFLMVLLGVCGGSVLLLWYVSKNVVKPVLLLNQNISRVSVSEDLSQQIHWPSRDEVGLLANSYNRMLRRLHETHSQMVWSQEKISHLAFHDTLTDLPNRAMLMQTLESALAQAQRDDGKLAVLFIGLDSFKLVNDTLGQGVGDQLLCAVADRLLETVRKNDFVARPGGDEFVIFMAHYGEGDAGSSGDEFVSRASWLAQRISKKLGEPFKIAEYETYVSSSIGISLYPDDEENADSLVQHADSALHRAKDLGGGHIQFYSSEFARDQKKRMELATRLNKAVEKDEFVLFYQPVVDLLTGRIVGAEALIRWQTGQELVSPGEFIPLAEEIGLILPIGNWIVKEACRQISKWGEAGVSLPTISINISARQLWHGDIVTLIQKVTKEQNIQSGSLELEITESSVMKEPLRMESMLKTLHEKGFNFALDDFGTGYSSLLRLKHLPIGKLKVDKSFVDGAPGAYDNESLVKAIVQLSQNLGIDAQAEGIETVEQWQFLREVGCRYGQGYYFSPAVSAQEIEEMVRLGRRWFL
ncbi:hypothetical protein A7E78_03960 [Syntrophotalea acetylenivorans]|uniref:EAL domain-containing protein n=1 Tax=Syntrophotalea acetylenivorans TaxID=1842532 RepID=A0A1L3GME5_9BACT|nr:EAL domain-containing protein [Syntrophotalea acetylenivorans]APG27061.1 hypothetical protein A7E78_03960 [Syntrophotalea acetylenivorans]